MKFDAVWETIAEERELFMFTVSRLLRTSKYGL